MKQIIVTIDRNREIAPATYKMVLDCREPGLHGIEKPGQFINIKLEGFFLRRPISICDWNEKQITIIYKTVGDGTKAMSQLEAGETLDILTPLGNGFEMAGCQKPVLIGGGAGIPPMYGLCKRFIEQGIKPEVIMGFNKESEAFYIEEFEKLGADVKVTTVDGSLGIKGFVTDALTNKQDAFYACGPEAMLRAIDRTADPNMKGYMSFEERMGCGFGACMGCSCKTKYGSKRICKDGPVLERSEVIW